MRYFIFKLTMILWLPFISFSSFSRPDSNQLSLSSLFSDNMVLQQNEKVAIWGQAGNNQTVYIKTSWGESVSAITDNKGNWKARFLTPAASFDPQNINIYTSSEKIVLSDVLIGEVWLCAGQSNMAFRLIKEDNGIQEILNAHKIPLRLFQIPANTSSTPLQDIKNARWEICDSNSVKNFSAVAYYFGKKLTENLKDTPIGLINASYGSATAEAFMSKKALLSKTYLAEHYKNYTSERPSKNPASCYNAMIHPLINYRIKGIAWYQGEANCVRASQYYETMKTLIKSWRSDFKAEKLAFYIVQLPPYKYSASQQEAGDPYSAATVREAQLKISQKIAHTGLVVTMDVGEVDDIHPSHKKPVGERLANQALHQSYGFTNQVYSGPVFKNYSIEDTIIRLSFDFVNNGIKDTYEELNWFTIAGDDKKFYQGNAFIDGNEVVVSSPFVDHPKAVRFAWYNAAVPNFFNNEGLPASPFRTDEWTDITYTTDITSWSLLPDIRNVPFDLTPPALSEESPAAGKRVKQTLAEYEGTNVYHTIYLPENWEEGKKYPVIVEYPGNGPYISRFGDRCSGKPEDTYLGYGISGGKDFIWIGMPFISADQQENQINWWGDIDASVNYTINTVNLICEQYGGDSSLVFVSGFSRGAIACNYIGLHNEKIAKLWCGSIANSHYDGLRTNWGYPDADKVSAKKRLQRLKGIPQIIIQEKNGPQDAKSYLENSDVEGVFTYLSIPYRNHDLRWVLQDIPQRKILRDWVNRIVKSKR